MSEAEVAQPPKEKKKKKSGVKKGDLPAAPKDVVVVPEPAGPTEPGTADDSGERKPSVAGEPCDDTAGTRRRSSAAAESSATTRKSSAAEDRRGRQRASISTAATRGGEGLLMDLDDDKLQELKEAFHLFDLDQDGFISFGDLKQTFITLGQNDIEEKDLRKMLSEASNPLDFDAFIQLLGYKTVELDPEEVLMNALAKWDYDNSGLISEERIKHDLMTWGDKFTAKEVEIALEDAPLYVNRDTGVGVIDYRKFCKILCGLRKKTRDPVVEDFMKH